MLSRIPSKPLPLPAETAAVVGSRFPRRRPGPGRCLRVTAAGLPLLVLALAGLTGCAATQTEGVVDPDYSGRTFDHPAVLVESRNILLRRGLESAIVDRLARLKISAESALDLLPPTRDFTAGERTAALTARGIDALIVVTVEKEGVETVTVPVEKVATTTQAGGGEITSETTYESRDETNRPWSVMTTRLLDLSNGRTAWIASSESHGTQYDTRGDVRDSFEISLIQSLVRAGLLHTTVSLKALEDPGVRSTIGGSR